MQRLAIINRFPGTPRGQPVSRIADAVSITPPPDSPASAQVPTAGPTHPSIDDLTEHKSRILPDIDYSYEENTEQPQSRTKESDQEPFSTKTTKDTPPPDLEGDIFDNIEDTGEGEDGLLSFFDEPSSVSSGGTTVSMRNMALPKHWSGRTPKVLLAEAVARQDRYAAITYRSLAGGSRARRSALSIRWDGKRADEWSMEDVACYDDIQAEQYIATVALHKLTFPPTEGFCVGNPSVSGTPTFFRLLPAPFRDLWQELENARRNYEDVVNRGIWSKLRSILGPKLTGKEMVSDLVSPCKHFYSMQPDWSRQARKAPSRSEQKHKSPAQCRVRRNEFGADCPCLPVAPDKSGLSRDAGKFR